MLKSVYCIARTPIHYVPGLYTHGYTGHVAELMARSDLAITKPGGLTVSECLAMRLPMILCQPVPG